MGNEGRLMLAEPFMAGMTRRALKQLMNRSGFPSKSVSRWRPTGQERPRV